MMLNKPLDFSKLLFPCLLQQTEYRSFLLTLYKHLKSLQYVHTVSVYWKKDGVKLVDQVQCQACFAFLSDVWILSCFLLCLNRVGLWISYRFIWNQKTDFCWPWMEFVFIIMDSGLSHAVYCIIHIYIYIESLKVCEINKLCLKLRKFCIEKCSLGRI